MNVATNSIIATIWASVSSWFTPTILFCLLNLMIGTIFLTSNFKSHKTRPPQQTQPNDHNPHNPTPLVRAPSILDRFRSVNFSLYRSDSLDPLQPQLQTQLVRVPSILDRVRSFKFSSYGSEYPDPTPDEIHDHHVTRTKSDNTGEGEVHPEAAAATRLRKSESVKLRTEEAERVDVRRPATVREGKQTARFGEDEGVDAKADDFINRFKQQLKLQRLDSLVRYKEMLTRSSGK